MRIAKPGALALVLAACGPLAGSPAAAPSAAPPYVASCPVTLAFQRPPDEIIDWAYAGSNPAITHEQAVELARTTNWAGSEGIWIALPATGIVRWPSVMSGSKFPLYAVAVGRASASAHRLDAATPAGFQASFGTPEQGYGPPGLIASGLTFPSRGCWEVTYRVGDARLTIVLEVRR